MNLELIEAEAATHGLSVFGGFNARVDDDLPEGTATVLLLGPAEPGFWPRITASPEWLDKNPDPIDRWSTRVIGQLANSLGGTALFPFGDPPYWPFYQWALRTCRAWASPVTLLVHDTAGLMVSYRGALALSQAVDLPAAAASPCDNCPTRPCVTACPAGAMTATGYDIHSCHAFLDRPQGADCLTRGCKVRRACPASQTYARLPEQSAHHMRQFHK